MRIYKAKLAPDRVARLDAIGFNWGERRHADTDDWDEMYMELLKFHVTEVCVQHSGLH